MRWLFALLVCSLTLMSASSFAEIYKYRDANGVLRFTDNPLEVPKDQQQSVQTYREAQILEEAGPAAEVEGMPEIAAKLEAEKERLAQVFGALEAERRQLEEEAKVERTEADNDVFEQRIKDYNLRLQQYEESRRLFQEKVDVYNQAMDATLK